MATAAKAWSTGLPNQGAGIKIGIIDDGIDQTHAYFSPAGYTMPPGYPKGQTAYTTAKVIVARAFAPAGTTWKYALKPFDPRRVRARDARRRHRRRECRHESGEHDRLRSRPARLPRQLQGAQRPDPGRRPRRQRAEIVAAIEAAVKDGMNVINLSIGEPEVEPSRDLVARAIDAAAAAGVIPVIAAGNDFDDYGRGSVASPGTAADAITVAAVTSPNAAGRSTIAGFSSAGPTTVSLRLKPDISAPGVSILSSVPGGWESMSGTSMATPQISGAAALLRERHPDWPVATIKAALMETGTSVDVDGQPAPPTRGGGGLARPGQGRCPARADVTLLRLLRPRPGRLDRDRPRHPDRRGRRRRLLGRRGRDDRGGARREPRRPGDWSSVPGTLDLTATTTTAAADGDLSGFVRLTRGADVRRIPFWLHVSRPALGGETATPHRRARAALRLHEREARAREPLPLSGRAGRRRRLLLAAGAGAGVPGDAEEAGDELRRRHHATRGRACRSSLGSSSRATRTASRATRRSRSTSTRTWSSSATPCSRQVPYAPLRRRLRRRLRQPDRGRRRELHIPLLAQRHDAAEADAPATARLTRHAARLPRHGRRLRGRPRHGEGDRRRPGRELLGAERRDPDPDGPLKRGTHRLRVQVSDYQESRNMENVPPILPNTRVLDARIVVR